MSIIVSEIPPEGLSIDCTRDGSWFESRAPQETARRYRVDEILFHCRADRSGRRVSIRGSVEIHCSTACTRCLELFSLSLRGDFFYAMTPVQAGYEQDSDTELAEGDLEAGIYRDDLIELEPIILEQVLLQFPISAVCSENCKGLCPVCGQNLNKGDCGHSTEETKNSPFTVLKNFKIAKKGS